MIADTPASAILRTDIYDRPPLTHWAVGRVALLGDAAHPMTPNLGQGACQAIEDAVVLADCQSSTVDVASALRAYEARRLDRANTVVRRSRQTGWIGQIQHPVLAWLRAAALSRLPAHLQRRQLDAALNGR